MSRRTAAVIAVDFQRKCLQAAFPLPDDDNARWGSLLREIEMMDPDKRLLMQFRFDHLPEHLRDVSRPFYSTAEWLIQNTPGSPERTLALRKLFEAKNYAVMGVILDIEEKDATAGG